MLLVTAILALAKTATVSNPLSLKIKNLEMMNDQNVNENVACSCADSNAACNCNPCTCENCNC
jgi:hypothetical protein